MTRTDRDIARQVTASISGDQNRAHIDVSKIVAEIVATYGLVDIDTIDHIEYWTIVARHDSTYIR